MRVRIYQIIFKGSMLVLTALAAEEAKAAIIDSKIQLSIFIRKSCFIAISYPGCHLKYEDF